ncbi:SCO2524 family protein [Actinoplanes sp. NPDC048988]|uniref:SCO2524 family protein n=1 Tax=Actinoplanes sp. NPDC048988 TaxID=3363901 RepID=UPI003714FEC6
MHIQPRQQILDIWRYTVRASLEGNRWRPGGGNSISDAEQLLCLMSPSTELDQLRISRPDLLSPDVEDALRDLGEAIEIPQRLLVILTAYINRYTGQDGTPVFSGGSYLRSSVDGMEPSPEQDQWDVVYSYAISVRLMLAIIGFTRDHQRVAKSDAAEQALTLEDLASRRLSAAMVGLLRSFTVSTFALDSVAGSHLMRMADQGRQKPEKTAEKLHEALREVLAGLRDDVTIEGPRWLFECGWSWGVVRGASPIETSAVIGRQPEGVAHNAPDLYFTTVALEAARALAANRTMLPAWLDPEQLRLVQQLGVRAELVRMHWATIATLESDGAWPVEDLPWRTTDGRESEYYSLLVAGSVLSQMTGERPAEDRLRRLLTILERLAERNGVTARMPGDDVGAARNHYQGMSFPLIGSETPTSPQLTWNLVDIAPALLKRTVELAAISPSGALRRAAIDLADRIGDHLALRRRPDSPGEGLWDSPAGVFSQAGAAEGRLDWGYTERVVDCLVAAARKVSRQRARPAKTCPSDRASRRPTPIASCTRWVAWRQPAEGARDNPGARERVTLVARKRSHGAGWRLQAGIGEGLRAKRVEFPTRDCPRGVSLKGRGMS